MDLLRSTTLELGRDTLTGLAGPENARARLERWLQKGPVHALLVSLGRLDSLNMAQGAKAGDTALAETATCLQHYAGNELDSPWFAARMSGNGILLVTGEACSRERWALLARGLSEEIERHASAGAEGYRLAPRITLLRATPGEDAASVFERLWHAQTALARKGGRRIAWVDGMPTRPGRSAARLEGDLTKAIEAGEIEILFQPQFALPGNRLTGAEALARWQHPQLGRIGAAALFSLAERAEIMAPLSQAIAAKALALAAHWPEDLRLSINVTSTDLAAETYPVVLAGIVHDSGFPPSRLTLEVTEQALLSDIELARQSLAALSFKGMAVALDDFGAGFCNFRYLKVLPLDYLKLDRSMVEGVAEDERDLAVLRGIVAMAKALDLGVIAEGIEDEAQRAAVEAEGCTCWQGFLGAEPMDAAAFLSLARRS